MNGVKEQQKIKTFWKTSLEPTDNKKSNGKIGHGIYRKTIFS